MINISSMFLKRALNVKARASLTSPTSTTIPAQAGGTVGSSYAPLPMNTPAAEASGTVGAPSNTGVNASAAPGINPANSPQGGGSYKVPNPANPGQSFQLPQINAGDIRGMGQEAAVNFMRATSGKANLDRNGAPSQLGSSVTFNSPAPGNLGGTIPTASIDTSRTDPNKRTLSSQYGTGGVDWSKSPGWQSSPERQTTIDGKTYTGADPMRQHLTPIVQGQQLAAQNAAVQQFDKANPGKLNDNMTAAGALPGQTPYQSLTDPGGLPGHQIPTAQQSQIAGMTNLNLPTAPPKLAGPPAASPPPTLTAPPSIPAPGMTSPSPAALNPKDQTLATAPTPASKVAAVQAWLNKSALDMSAVKAPTLGAVPDQQNSLLKSPSPASAPAPVSTPTPSRPVFKGPNPSVKPAPKPESTHPFGFTQYGDMKAPAVRGIVPNLHQGLDELGEHASSALLHVGNWLGSNLFGSPQTPVTDWKPDFQKRWAERAQQQNQGYLQAGDPAGVKSGAALNFAIKCAAFASAVMHTPSGLANNAGTSTPQFGQALKEPRINHRKAHNQNKSARLMR